MKNFLSYSSKAILSFTLMATVPSLTLAAECNFMLKFTQDDEGGTRKVKVYQSKPMGSKKPLASSLM